MKATFFTALAFSAAAMAAPMNEHAHHHHNQQKRAMVTQVMYVNQDGSPLSSAQGAGGAGASQTQTVQSSSPTSETPSSSTSDSSSGSGSSESQSPSSSSGGSSSGSSSSGSSSSGSQSPSSSSSDSSSGSGSSSESGTGALQSDAKDLLGLFKNPTQDFEDGKHKCDEVPSGQGVIPIPWVKGIKGGWTSIMNEQGQTSSECKDGYYCSYACQPGMSKTQWPDNQPSSGISVGGLYCKDGYLYKSNKQESKLCSWGFDTASFESKLNKELSLCRTDYPGSESMVIPTVLKSGGLAPASVVDSSKYYKWKQGKTSAQYYVNNAGVSAEKGCQWGESGSGIGNWAPVVLGSGKTDGKTYLSLIPNPNNKNKPNFNVKIEGDDVNGDCSYEDGQYKGGHGSDGCTVTVNSGKARFVFYS